MKKDFFKRNRCAIPLIFLLVYGIPIIYLFTNYTPSILFISRVIGLIAILNVFTQVMLGSFRTFFNKHYNPLKVYSFHNYLGLFTLIISLVHVLIHGSLGAGLINALLFNSDLFTNLGTIAFYLMIITVIPSDLKYFFKIDFSTKAWRVIHLFNYSLFPLLFGHAIYLSITLRNVVNYYLFIALLIAVIIAGFYKGYKKLKSRNVNS